MLYRLRPEPAVAKQLSQLVMSVRDVTLDATTFCPFKQGLINAQNILHSAVLSQKNPFFFHGLHRWQVFVKTICGGAIIAILVDLQEAMDLVSHDYVPFNQHPILRSIESKAARYAAEGLLAFA